MTPKELKKGQERPLAYTVPPRISLPSSCLHSGGVLAKIYKKLNTYYRDPVEKNTFQFRLELALYP